MLPQRREIHLHSVIHETIPSVAIPADCPLDAVSGRMVMQDEAGVIAVAQQPEGWPAVVKLRVPVEEIRLKESTDPVDGGDNVPS
jgi:hypothetical protein